MVYHKVLSSSVAFLIFLILLHSQAQSIQCLSTQRALCAGNLALLAANNRSRLLRGYRQRLESALGSVVVVVAAQAVDVQSDARTLRKALQAVGDHLAAQLSEKLALQAQVDDAVGAVREIDDGAGEGLVERGVGVSEAGDAGERAEGLVEGVAEGDADVFGGVVVVDLVLSVSKRRTWLGECWGEAGGDVL